MSRTRIPLSRQDEQARLMKERLEMSTAEIGLSVRTTNCLEERGIFTVRDLLEQHARSAAQHRQLRREDAGRGLQGPRKVRLLRNSRQKAAVGAM